jgi:hypothetical protein
MDDGANIAIRSGNRKLRNLRPAGTGLATFVYPKTTLEKEDLLIKDWNRNL